MLRIKFQLIHSREANLHQQSPSPSSPFNKERELIISRHSNRHAPRNTKERKVRSKIRWFTEFCNSHYLSHFAAFFIDARAKRSVVESCIKFHLIIRLCILHYNVNGLWWRAKRSPSKSVTLASDKPRLPLRRTTTLKVHRCWVDLSGAEHMPQ